jgi:ATPase subunit of ABC transporter with duplicated ATPase domains
VRNINRKGTKNVAQGRKTRLNKLLKANPDFLEKPKHTRELSFKFAEVENRGKRVNTAIECKNLTKSFGNLTLFENLSFEIFTGERTGIIGPNGMGKTTLLKLALGQIEPTSGTIELKKNLSIGYLDQAGAELIGKYRARRGVRLFLNAARTDARLRGIFVCQRRRV